MADLQPIVRDVTFGACASLVDAAAPGLGAGSLPFVRKFAETLLSKPTADDLDAFLKCLERELMKQLPSRRGRDWLEQATKEDVAPSISTALAVLRRVRFESGEFMSRHRENPEAAAQATLDDAEGVVAFPEDDRQRELCVSIVTAWFAAMAAQPVQLGAIEREFRQELLDRTKALPEALADFADQRSFLLDVDILAPRQKRFGVDVGSPAAMLVADYGIVDFHGREKEIDDLIDWCQAPKEAAVRLYWGDGGSGKTRLMIESAARLRALARDPPWRAGFLDLTGTSLEDDHMRRLIERSKSLFVVIDYAETSQDKVRQLIELAWSRRVEKQIRIVLIARAPSDWWRRLGDRLPQENRLMKDHAGEVELRGLAMDEQDRRAIFDGAHRDFLAALGEAAQAVDETMRPDLTAAHFESVLVLHAAAHAVARGRRFRSTEDLFDEIRGRERRYWQRWLDKMSPEWHARTELVEASIALLILNQGAATRPAVKAIVQQALAFHGHDDGIVDPLTDLVCRLYPGDRGGAAPLRPDLIGEYLVDRTLTTWPELADGLLAPDADDAALHNPLTVLTRLAKWRPSGKQHLHRLLQENLAHLIRPAISAAQETGDPIGRIAAAVLTDREDVVLAESIVDDIPYPTVALRELGAAASLLCTGEPLQADADERHKSNRAGHLNDLSNRLADLGKPDEALQAIEQAVEIYRELAQTGPYAFRPDLANSLNNLSNRLADLGKRNEALETSEQAVEIRRELAQARPDDFRPDLAMSLNNLSLDLADLGKGVEALEAIEHAVEIYRELAQAQPDAFRPVLANSLNNLSLRLADLGKRDETIEASEQAVEIRRELAQAHPDAFRPDLASSLNNLSVHLADLDKGVEALEAIEQAVDIRRELAQARPDAFRPDLARSLNNLSLRLADLGKGVEALQVSEQAIEIYRELAQARPDAHVPDLCRGLGAWSLRLDDAGRTQEASRRCAGGGSAAGSVLHGRAGDFRKLDDSACRCLSQIGQGRRCSARQGVARSD